MCAPAKVAAVYGPLTASDIHGGMCRILDSHAWILPTQEQDLDFVACGACGRPRMPKRHEEQTPGDRLDPEYLPFDVEVYAIHDLVDAFLRQFGWDGVDLGANRAELDGVRIRVGAMLDVVYSAPVSRMYERILELESSLGEALFGVGSPVAWKAAADLEVGDVLPSENMIMDDETIIEVHISGDWIVGARTARWERTYGMNDRVAVRS